MSDEGERRGPRTEQQDDWWRQLYEADTRDTGGAEGGDTLDDRFASVTRTVGSRAGRTSGPTAERRDGAPSDVTRSEEPAGLAEPNGSRSTDQPEGPDQPEGRREPEARDEPERAGEPPRSDDVPGWPATDSLDPWHLGPTYPEPPATDEPAAPERPSTDPAPEAAAPAPAAQWPVAPAAAHTTQVSQHVPEPEPVAEPSASEPAPDANAAPEPAPTTRAAEPGLSPQADQSPQQPAPSPAAATGPEPAEERSATEPPTPPARRPEPAEPPAAHPEQLAELVPDTVLDGARHGRLALRATSLRGDTARELGEPRRDALFTARFGQGGDALLLVAMATGAGPAAVAGAAARDACHSIAETVGRSHTRLAEDIAAGRRTALKSGLQRLTDRSYGRLCLSSESGPPTDEAEPAPALRCLLLPADPDCPSRVFFGIGGGGLFRLREGVWQDIEPSVAQRPESAEHPPSTAGTTGAPAAPGPAGARQHAEAPADSAGAAPYAATEPGADPRATMHLGFPAPATPEQPPPEPFRTEPARPQPFLFRASTARPGDTLLLASAGLAEPLREAAHFAERLAARWSDTAGPPELAAFLAEVQPRPRDVYGADRTAAAVWEG
ncbi:protein phosphatase 2C domain-containing protein [Streptomyces oceani]|uniref:PPM-type phosphatase domain-containing protein n=1 Tax=Streptomyces oceani TaxID=1075402 RepID=A0A1E7KKA5_9ACTN|nr:protein phosphatase 2C domain-containing protein [Streptomyces oceani]OEV04316.1 hypothetical protein AN216_09070 [Streptomyces oceani]